jgi:hypothetical protein
MPLLQPPPTYEIPIQEDQFSQTLTFSPLWLKWFLDLAQAVSGKFISGGNHNSLSGLQGGSATASPGGEFYHLGLSAYNALVTGPTSDASLFHAHRQAQTSTPPIPAPGASPGTWTNTSLYDQWYSVQGSVTAITYLTNGGTTVGMGAIAGMFKINPGDSIQVAWSGSPPTVVAIQR